MQECRPRNHIWTCHLCLVLSSQVNEVSLLSCKIAQPWLLSHLWDLWGINTCSIWCFTQLHNPIQREVSRKYFVILSLALSTKPTVTLGNLKLKVSSPLTSSDRVEIIQAWGQTAYFRVGFPQFTGPWPSARSLASLGFIFCLGAEITQRHLLERMSWDQRTNASLVFVKFGGLAHHLRDHIEYESWAY